MFNFKNQLLFSTALISILSGQSIASDPQEDSPQNTAQSSTTQLPTEVRDFLEAKKVEGNIDQEVEEKFIKLQSLMPNTYQDENALNAIYELAEHFGYNFLDGGVRMVGTSIDSLFETSRAEDRPELVQILNEIFNPVVGSELKQRQIRGYFVSDFHKLYPQDRVPKLRNMNPVILKFLDGCKDRNTILNIVGRLAENGQDWQMEKFQSFLNSFQYALEKLKPRKGYWSLLIEIEKQFDDDVDGHKDDLHKIIDLLGPLSAGVETIDPIAYTIPKLLSFSETDRQDIVKHCQAFQDTPSLSSILDTIATVDENERDSLVQSVVSIRDYLQIHPFSIFDVVKAFAPLSAQQRDSLSDKLKEISAHKKIGKMQYSFLLPELTEIDDEDWQELYQSAIPLIDELGLSSAIAELKKLRVERRPQAIANYQTVTARHGQAYNGNLSRLCRKELFVKVATMDAEELDNILPHILPFLSLTEYPLDIVHLIDIFQSIPLTRYGEISKNLQPLGRYLKNLSIFAMAVGLSADELNQLPPLIQELLAGIEDSDLVTLVIQEMTEYPANRRLAFHQVVSPYLQDFRTASTRASFLKAAKIFPNQQSLQLCVPILTSLQTNLEHAAWRLAKIPQEQMADTMQIANLLAGGIVDGTEFGRILGVATLSEPTERAEIAGALRDYLPLIRNFGAKIQFAAAFQRLSAEQRQTCRPLCQPFMQVHDYGQAQVLSQVAIIPDAERENCIEKTREILGQQKDGFLFADTLRTVYSLNQFGGEGLELLDSFVALFQKFKYQGIQVVSLDFYAPKPIPSEVIGKHDIRRLFMTVLEPLPYEVLKNSLEALIRLEECEPIQFNEVSRSPLAIIEFLRSHDVIQVDQLVNYWTDYLRTNSNKVRVKRLADFITTYFNWFGLFEEDDIVQQAIRSGILLENSNDPLNPYRIFENLERRRDEQVDWNAIDPSTETLGGISVQYNPTFFNTNLSQYGLTFADLPHHSPLFLQACLEAMEKRLQQEPLLVEEINKSAGASLADLKESSLSDGILYRLAATRGEKDECVNIMVARMSAIISYLETLSVERQSGDLFSPQEDGFLKLLSSLQGCSPGKTDGVNAYYLNVLPAEHRFSATVTYGEDDIAHLQSIAEVSAILLEEVEKMFLGHTHLMKHIVGLRPGDTVQQAGHQAAYLRNLIGHTVGLQDQLVFDAHTQTLYQHLVAISKQDALQAFFRFFTPSGFIYRICEKYHLDIDGTIEMLQRMEILAQE